MKVSNMKISNMLGRTGRQVPNQFVIQGEAGIYFQSYKSVIAPIDSAGGVTLDETYWDYSRTTSKYLRQFLSVYAPRTLYMLTDTMEAYDRLDAKRGIEHGVYKLADLN